MLALLEDAEEKAIVNKVILDFSYGPRDSLYWAKKADRRIGVDVLVPAYYDLFNNSMKNHEMEYVTSTENYIPLPDNTADVVITINSLDHVDNIEQIVSEMMRV